MAARPEQPEAFLAGCAFPASGSTPYPRAKRDDRLPADTWAMARVPVGVRIEAVGVAAAAKRLGATLVDLRTAMESVVQGRIGDGDKLLSLIPGRDLIDASLLADGIHPTDAGHARLAETIDAVVAEVAS